ncbi:hypothetical protein LIER_31964 [Lithospermum erythrorhizon]|uniref:BED-type domain-containing protein n=1 Tax=Lithospermum erythrorhizon TaxID=34254 RepID=A0AAV3RYH1_LITER
MNMSSMMDKLANTFVTIEASGSRFVKSMSTAVEDWIELKKHLDLAKKLLLESFAELQLKEKQLSLIQNNSRESQQEARENELRMVQSKIMRLDNEYEQFHPQLSTQSMNPVPSPHEVGEANNLSIVPANIVVEPKQTKSQTGQGKKGLKYEVWNHFTKIQKENEKPNRGKCKYCSKTYHIRSTRSMHEHITMGRCHVYVDINDPMKRELMDASSSTKERPSSHGKKQRVEIEVGNQVEVFNPSLLIDNEHLMCVTNYASKFDFPPPPPSYWMNNKHEKLSFMSNMTSNSSNSTSICWLGK